MSDESELEETRALWQNQSSSSLRIPADVMRARIMKIDASMRRAKLAVIVGGSVTVPVFGWVLYTLSSPVQRIGRGIILIGVVLLVIQVLRLVATTRAAAGTGGSKPSVVAYRAVLEHQRQFHGGAGAWSRLIAFSAAGVVFLVGGSRVGGRATVVAGAGWIVLALGVFINGRVQARRYQHEIDEIDHLQSEES